MTEHKSFKRLVRARMEKTGESYTSARAMLLRAEDGDGFHDVKLATSDESIRRRTGRGWEEWFEMLDEWGATNRTHRETARWLAKQQDLHPLAWNVQAIAASYERARGLRVVGEKDDGFVVTASRTVAAPIEALFDAFVDERRRERWLPGGQLRERTTTPPRSARFDWGDGDTRVNVTFLAKGETRSTAALEHRRLADDGEAQRMKSYWRERLTALKSTFEQ
jgi:hypothetical protein